MNKNIFKEIIIILLLALAIILILGVILYEYIPTNKIIPEKVSYITPENIKQEIETDTSVDDTEVVITYQIDSTDLNNYEKIQEYVPGKKNPFSALNEKVENNNSSNTEANTNNNTSSSTTEENTGYLPNKGTK